MQKHSWLPRVKDELGVSGGKFDFAVIDMPAKEAAYKAAVHAMDSRGSRVDKSIIQKYERAEREIVSLTERQQTLTRDRDTIIKVWVHLVHADGLLDAIIVPNLLAVCCNFFKAQLEGIPSCKPELCSHANQCISQHFATWSWEKL
jgi:hypothetical protein